MSKNISNKPKLSIISDTSMFINRNKYVVEPVLREVESIAHLFHSIKWLGYKNNQAIPKNAKRVTNRKITLFSIYSSGGDLLYKKLKIFIFFPYYIYSIVKVLRGAEIVHVRGPSIPALLTIFLSYFYKNKLFWHKYAGNWQLSSNAISYNIQKWLLNRKIPGIVIVSNVEHPVIISVISTWYILLTSANKLSVVCIGSVSHTKL